VTSDRAASGLARHEFVALYERTHGAIFRYGSRRVGVDLAEELTASTFAEAWAARWRYDAALSTPATWVWSIATKLVNKHLRSEARRIRALARFDYEPFARESTEDSDRRLDAEKQWSEVALKIAALEERDRDILFLFAWSDLSYEEISEVLGIPIGTVKSRLSRARARIGGPLKRAVS
jgi:RNA polymerase sigma factor (sigma-70 family)